jgi:hypothetical protein
MSIIAAGFRRNKTLVLADLFKWSRRLLMLAGDGLLEL